MTRNENRAYLEEEIEDWRVCLKTAFLNVVNAKRKAHKLPLYPREIPIYIPSGPSANMFLLTLKVWCLRLHVTPEWLLEKLLWLFRGRRKPDDNPKEIDLGLPANFLVGTVARNYIQDRLDLEFPNQENRKSKLIPAPHEIRLNHFDFSLSETVKEYADAVIKERERFERVRKTKHARKRNYRQVE